MNTTIKPGNLVRLSIQYHLRTNNGYLRLYEWPDNPAKQERIIYEPHGVSSLPSIDLTCPTQYPPLLYLGEQKITNRLNNKYVFFEKGRQHVHHIVHLFLLEKKVYCWVINDIDEELFYQWFELVLQ